MIKYFREASEDGALFSEVIKGTKDNKLISKPSQTPNQELEEIEAKVLKIIKKKKNSLGMLLNI